MTLGALSLSAFSRGALLAFSAKPLIGSPPNRGRLLQVAGGLGKAASGFGETGKPASSGNRSVELN